MEKDNKKENEIKEKTTKCGEQIPSQFSWMSLDNQKKKANELNKISKNK